MIYDQWHQFNTEADYIKLLGNGRDVETNARLAAWLADDVTVIASDIRIRDAAKDKTVDLNDGLFDSRGIKLPIDMALIKGAKPPSGFWFMVSTADADKAEKMRKLSSAKVGFIRPETPTYYKDAAAWSKINLANLEVLSATVLAGSTYIFD